MKNITELVVKYNGYTVGYLAEVNGEILFQYDDEWLKNGFSISPFSLPLEKKIFKNSKNTFNGLFGVFSDSLPDGWGELLLRRKLLKQGISLDNLSPLQGLALVSNKASGALTYEPSIAEEKDYFISDLDKLAINIDEIYNESSNNLDEVFALAGSSNGSRPKAFLNYDNHEWIVKFPTKFDGPSFGKLEFMVNQKANEYGINLPKTNLFSSKICDGYFGSARFDRQNGKRIHMISLSSVLETSFRIPNLDYSHYFQVVRKICQSKSELEEAYRRMCFNVIIGNKDDHGKNFAFLFDENKGKYVLSPAYDLTITKDKLEHEMTIFGNANPTPNELPPFSKI